MRACLLLSLFLSCLHAVALDSVEAFRATKELCVAKNESASTPKKWFRVRSPAMTQRFYRNLLQPLARASAQESFTQMTIKVWSATAQTLIDNEGFQLALKKCASQVQIDEIYEAIRVADVQGKMLAGTGYLIAAVGSWALVSRVAILSPAAARVVNAGMVAAPAIPIYLNLRESFAARKAYDQHCGGTAQGNFECINGVLNEMKAAQKVDESFLEGMRLAFVDQLDTAIEARELLSESDLNLGQRLALDLKIARFKRLVAGADEQIRLLNGSLE